MERHIFDPELIANMGQHQAAIEQLKTIGNFWIGPDVKLEKKIVVRPLGLVQGAGVVVNKEDLPAIDINRGAFASFRWSVRSFLAQSGIDIMFHHGDVSDEMIQAINEGKDVAIPIDIVNYTDRPIELEGKIMRFFWTDDAKRLRHGALREAMKSDLVIDGEEGKDWFFQDVDLEDDIKRGNDSHSEKMKDVCIRIPFKERFYVPKSDEPLNIKSRKDLPDVLKEIPPGLKAEFKIGETAKVKLSENIIAVINTGAYEKGKRHIFSPLIDSGFEGKIRTEAFHGLDYIELFLYRK